MCHLAHHAEEGLRLTGSCAPRVSQRISQVTDLWESMQIQHLHIVVGVHFPFSVAGILASKVLRSAHPSKVTAFHESLQIRHRGLSSTEFGMICCRCHTGHAHFVITEISDLHGFLQSSHLGRLTRDMK